MSCPVDHSSLQQSSQPSSPSECPVDHTTRSSWRSFLPFGSSKQDPPPSSSSTTPALSTSREVSTIPNAAGANWVYPSEAQFFAAMARKNHSPEHTDMRVVVPIHNAVNERAWAEIQKWEQGRGGDKCGGVKLVSFKGKPNDLSPKARWKTLLGYTRPFDRHDWLVDRCGVQTRYIIDFYTGRASPIPQNMSFYLDVRPALDNWEGVKMRVGAIWDGWFGAATPARRSAPSNTNPPS